MGSAALWPPGVNQDKNRYVQPLLQRVIQILATLDGTHVFRSIKSHH